MTRFILSLAIATLLIQHQATAQETTITAFGNPDCGSWRHDVAVQNMQAWLMGYLSGLNAMNTILSGKNDNPLSELKSAGQAITWMDNYCRDNPLETAATGARKLFLELAKRKTERK